MIKIQALQRFIYSPQAQAAFQENPKIGENVLDLLQQHMNYLQQQGQAQISAAPQGMPQQGPQQQQQMPQG